MGVLNILCSIGFFLFFYAGLQMQRMDCSGSETRYEGLRPVVLSTSWRSSKTHFRSIIVVFLFCITWLSPSRTVFHADIWAPWKIVSLNIFSWIHHYWLSRNGHLESSNTLHNRCRGWGVILLSSIISLQPHFLFNNISFSWSEEIVEQLQQTETVPTHICKITLIFCKIMYYSTLTLLDNFFLIYFFWCKI